MAQIAASIEYEDAPPPGGLPDDMQAPSGSSLRFLPIKAIDGFQVQAALWQPEDKPPAETTIIVQMHGSGGNLARSPFERLRAPYLPKDTPPSASARDSTTIT